MPCCDTPGLMPVSAALSLVLEHTQPLTKTQEIPLDQALNRILAEDIFSPLNVPSFANSAMDGYAVTCSDLAQNNALPLNGQALAGSPFNGPWTENTCVRIMTGAKVPSQADAVIMQEDTHIQDARVFFHTQPTPQQNIRPIGDDVKKGERVLQKGTLLTAREIPMLATLGIAHVKVFHKPTVAFFSTGDELRQVGSPLADGEIYDSNRYTLAAMLEKLHCKALDFGVVPDCPTQLRETLLRAVDAADLVITSGGVSVGDADHTKDILEDVGEVTFWKIAIKPGKPFAFGNVKNTLFCGLPGNPVSVLVTLHVFVEPLIAKLSGHSQWKAPLRLKAKAQTRFYKSPGRTDYQRAVYHLDEEGALCVSTTGNQGSGAFSSLSLANCFAVLEQDRGHVETGETLYIEPFGCALN